MVINLVYRLDKDKCFLGQEAGHIGMSYGGKKKKVVCAVELTEAGKEKRFYALQIKDF